jgi:hypothetical protein
MVVSLFKIPCSIFEFLELVLPMIKAIMLSRHTTGIPSRSTWLVHAPMMTLSFGESGHAGKMGAESGVLCRRFLLRSHLNLP